jgi:hypothetical protein
MAAELRVRVNGIGGLVEDNPLTSSATTLTSAGLAAVPVIGTTQHLAVVLDPDGQWGAPEIVYITAHTAGATTATIVRAKEGTTARAHERDVPWVHGATANDFAVPLDAAVYESGASFANWTAVSGSGSSDGTVITVNAGISRYSGGASAGRLPTTSCVVEWEMMNPSGGGGSNDLGVYVGDASAGTYAQGAKINNGAATAGSSILGILFDGYAMTPAFAFDAYVKFRMLLGGGGVSTWYWNGTAWVFLDSLISGIDSYRMNHLFLYASAGAAKFRNIRLWTPKLGLV